MKQRAARLKNFRIGLKITQEAFAEKIGMSYSYYIHVENAVKPITINMLDKIHAKFNISADYILYGVEDTVSRDPVAMQVAGLSGEKKQQVDALVLSILEISKGHEK